MNIHSFRKRPKTGAPAWKTVKKDLEITCKKVLEIEFLLSTRRTGVPRSNRTRLSVGRNAASGVGTEPDK